MARLNSTHNSGVLLTQQRRPGDGPAPRGGDQLEEVRLDDVVVVARVVELDACNEKGYL